MSLSERETKIAKAARLKKIIAALDRAYPGAHCELEHVDPLQLLVATILSAQCTDKRVNIVTKGLFKKYRSAADYANAPLAELEQAIKSTGFFRNKAKNLQAGCRKLVERHGGRVPDTMEELTQLDGVGRKTANVVLGNAFGINVGVVVDTHVARLSQRLGLTTQKTPEKIERDLMTLVPQKQWTLFSHWLIWHGRRRCPARKPGCGECEIRVLCPRIGVKAFNANIEHRTLNAEHRTSNFSDERETAFGVRRSMFDVQCWLFLNSGSCPPAFNMALDEALLEAAARLGQPVLRFYGWTEPAATFGYFQKYAEVERATRLRPLIRRPTGGGIVPHDADWTYSLVFPPGHEWHALRAEASYRRVHEWIQRAFAKFDVATELAPTRHPSPVTRHTATGCFVGHEKHDLLWGGKKIAGAAQRRNRLGLLIQGSVQPPPARIARPDWEQAMADVGCVDFEVKWLAFEPDPALRERAEALARGKYSQKEFNSRR